jgi:nitrate/nitrite-specific signal transduction histidine kinase
VSTTRKQSSSSPVTPRNEMVARKIHDDVTQKLTVLGIELALLEAKLPKKNALAPKIQQLSKLTTEIAMSVREVMEALTSKEI